MIKSRESFHLKMGIGTAIHGHLTYAILCALDMGLNYMFFTVHLQVSWQFGALCKHKYDNLHPYYI